MTVFRHDDSTSPLARGKNFRTKDKERRLLCLLLGLFAAFLFIFPTRLKTIDDQLKSWELQSSDIRMRLRSPRKVDPKIIIVGITDVEHFLHGAGIYSREAYFALLQILASLKARAVIFDILFEYPQSFDSTIAFKMQEIPSYLSYKFIKSEMPFDELEKDIAQMDAGTLSEWEASLTSDTINTHLMNAIEAMDQLGSDFSEAEKNRAYDKTENIDRNINRLKFQISRLSRMYLDEKYGLPEPLDPDIPIPEEQFVILPAPLLLLAARGLGFINIIKEKEDVVRRVPLFIRYKNKIYPHLDLVFLCDYYGVKPCDLNIEFGKYVSFYPTKNHTGTKRIPIDDSGNILINFRQNKDTIVHNSYSLHQALHYGRYGDLYPTRIKPEDFQDAIVIVGDMSPGGADVEPIPLSPAFPMVGVHASLIDMVLKDDYVKQPGAFCEIALTLAVGIIMGLLFIFLEYRPASIISLAFLIIYLGFSILLSGYFSLFIPMVRPAGTLALSYIFLIFYILGIKERERRKVKNIFLKSVSPRIGEEILRHYDNEAIWGVKKEITILYVDIRGFTSLSEILGARELVDFLDSYYDAVSEIIFQYDGVVNKFIGDAVLAIFGAPLEIPDAPCKALCAALDIQAAMKILNVNPHLKRHELKVAVGIGISTGEAVVGTVGRKKIRIEYTALGDSVNVAERLQGKAGPGEILLNKESYDKIQSEKRPELSQKNIHFIPLEPMLLKGKENPVQAYKVEY
ncbi:adenylate/guanylate cyclase domain-containing protein [Candidatus Sumerlaeota bacterium]|nr:adenylate/guanylate cyclase domain-containing protein [Candidatus Sumerlaeota bacterium]